MVKLTKIYTRGGDKGATSLADGSRVAKHDLRVAAYGSADETGAAIGLARLESRDSDDALLSRIQNDLFDLGADLATPEAENPKYPPLRIAAAQVAYLEAEIDRLNAELEPLNSFVLSGGRPAAARLHFARTVARRTERQITALAAVEMVNPEAVKYINRLSDLLFVMARHANDKGRADVLWIPGANR
ncbi:MAG: cob(I)yrinic acid a,c-diamide adenosyltransferase [Rhodospirillales bacterium]|nr:cob(I)yrinic acid a,c-diamide adenosyltransferase [Rhodospirillales bacterium]